MKTEAVFYNAVNVFKEGDFRAIAKLRAGDRSWEKIWRELKNKSGADPEKEFKKLEKRGVKLFLNDDDEFPALLKEISPAPFGIYVLGELKDDVLKIAVVGTRKASPAGKKIAKKFSEELALAGVAVVSGLAMGIDAAAHEGAVSKKGKTVAVLANGLDRTYPAQNEKLAGKIFELGGALVSEYPLGSPMYPARFLERNRIISGLSLGTVVVEAPLASGAINTACHTIDQNRELFVVPGGVDNSNYAGSNNLIKTGARLVTEAGEILNELGIKKTELAALAAVGKITDKNQQIVFEAIAASGAIDVDKISALTKLNAQTINQSLTFLMISGIVKETGGKYHL